MSDDIHLQTPLSENDARNLQIGDFVYLHGQIHTGRALVYQHTLEAGIEPPIDIAGTCNVQMHGAPAGVEDEPGKYRVSSIQATASFRYWRYVGDYMRRFGVRAIIGKGGMDQGLYEDVFATHGAVFLTTVGYGIAAKYGRGVTSVEAVYWQEELGLPEAMWVLNVADFGPFIVDGDCTVATLAARGVAAVNKNFREAYGSLPQHILKRMGEVDDTLAEEVIMDKKMR